MKFVFSCSIHSFKYFSICITTVHGFTVLLNFMSLPSTQPKMLAWEQIL
jgi:hypothetical protein